MKRLIVTYSVSAVVAGLLMTSCVDKKTHEQLKLEAQQIEAQLEQRDSAYNEIMRLMNEVETQIDEIKVRENLVSARSEDGEFSEEVSTMIVEDMKRINELIAASNQQIQKLDKDLKGANIEVKAFKNRMSKLSKDLEEQTQMISQLQQELETRDERIKELGDEVQSLATTVSQQSDSLLFQQDRWTTTDTKLHKAYFTVESERKLRDEGFLTKEGGFLGIGGTMELVPNTPASKLTEIDTRETKRIYVNSEKAEIVTNHPADSYEMVKDEDLVKYIEVKDPEKFWQISRYLVVSTKG